MSLTLSKECSEKFAYVVSQAAAGCAHGTLFVTEPLPARCRSVASAGAESNTMGCFERQIRRYMARRNLRDLDELVGAVRLNGLYPCPFDAAYVRWSFRRDEGVVKVVDRSYFACLRGALGLTESETFEIIRAYYLGPPTRCRPETFPQEVPRVRESSSTSSITTSSPSSAGAADSEWRSPWRIFIGRVGSRGSSTQAALPSMSAGSGRLQTTTWGLKRAISSSSPSRPAVFTSVPGRNTLTPAAIVSR